MTTQTPLPFDNPIPALRKSRKHKQHRSTSASALLFDEVKTHRNKGFLLILTLLAEFDFREPQRCLTARQMLRLLKARGLVNPNAGRNYLSPRLTELLGLACVENPQGFNEEGEEVEFLKRVNNDCAAFAWRITSKGRELLDCLHRLHKEAKQ